MIKGRCPSCTLTLLLLVSVDDVEESSPRVCRRQLLHRVVRPQRHRLLIALVHEGEFALVREVVRGVGRDYFMSKRAGPSSHRSHSSTSTSSGNNQSHSRQKCRSNERKATAVRYMVFVYRMVSDNRMGSGYGMVSEYGTEPD